MKKSLIALAVAGAMTAPMVAQADATVYGDIEYNMNFNDDSDALGRESDFDANMGHVRFGLKGTVDNDIDGLTTGYRFEFQMPGGEDGYASGSTDGEVKTRQANLYMAGGFGKVTFGQQSNPADNAEVLMGQDGDWLYGITDRLEAIVYEAPLEGVSIAVGMINDYDNNTDNKDVDGVTANLGFEVAGFGVNLGYTAVDNGFDEDADVVALGVTYEIDALSLMAMYESASDDEADVDADLWTLGAGFSFGAASVYGQYVNVDSDSFSDDGTMALVGVDYALGKTAKVGIEYYDFNDEGEQLADGGDGVADYLSLFYRLKF